MIFLFIIKKGYNIFFFILFLRLMDMQNHNLKLTDYFQWWQKLALYTRLVKTGCVVKNRWKGMWAFRTARKIATTDVTSD